MRYGDYEAVVTFDEDAALFHGEVTNLRDVVTFQGTSVDELRKAFAVSIADYLELCATRGEPPEAPFSRTLVNEWASDQHYAVEAAQAAKVRPQAVVGGLRFDSYLTPAEAAWVLDEIERGRFLSPADIVFVAMQAFRELENYPDLKKELLRRKLQEAMDDPRPGIPADEAFERLEREMDEMEKHQPAVWREPHFS